MSTNSRIEWTEATWNPVTGCARVSAGCDHCYAVTMSHRLEGMGQAEKYGGLTVLNNRGERHFNGVVRCHDDALDIPLKRKKPTMYFVNSMSDLFHEAVPFDFIDRVFAVMALCPQHTMQVLSKRPERMVEYFSSLWSDGWAHRFAVTGFGDHNYFAHNAPLPFKNVWLGTSVEDQDAADERIPHLLRCPAAVRFLSCEPLLGPVDLSGYFGGEYATAIGSEPNYNAGIHWVIVGGESGKGARPCDLKWIHDIVRQCRSAAVPMFVKQLGSKPENTDPSLRCGSITSRKGGKPDEWPEQLRIREMPRLVKLV